MDCTNTCDCGCTDYSDFFDNETDMDSIISSVNEGIERYIKRTMREVTCKEIRLDERCGSRFWISEEGLVGRADTDKRLQYYGGFEYEKDQRSEIGDYVFYSSDSSRVSDHISRVLGIEETEEE